MIDDDENYIGSVDQAFVAFDPDQVYNLAYQALTGSNEPWGGCDQREVVERIANLILDLGRPRVRTFKDGSGTTWVWSHEHLGYLPEGAR